jgi:hypothetical protein
MIAWITLPIVVPFSLTTIFLITLASKIIEISRISIRHQSTHAQKEMHQPWHSNF